MYEFDLIVWFETAITVVVCIIRFVPYIPSQYTLIILKMRYNACNIFF
jgi:hypothetical protein